MEVNLKNLIMLTHLKEGSCFVFLIIKQKSAFPKRNIKYEILFNKYYIIHTMYILYNYILHIDETADSYFQIS